MKTRIKISRNRSRRTRGRRKRNTDINITGKHLAFVDLIPSVYLSKIKISENAHKIEIQYNYT